MERRHLSLRDARRLHAANGSTANSKSGGSHPHARAYRIARQSGSLNLSTREIKAFPHEILRLHELAEEDERSWDCAPLHKVDLSYNDIHELPVEVKEFAYLMSFKMRHNQLHELPDTFWELTKLTSLDLSNNLLVGTLSENLGQLVNLKELSLDGNNLSALPESTQQLENLEVLKLENNQLRSLPSQIGHLRRLHTLTAHSNQLAALPESFGLLANLTTLDLHKNNLKTTGDALVQLGSLRFLDLHQNKLDVFPELPTTQNPALDHVSLGFNALTSISESSILRVKDSITVLDVRENRLQTLPEKIAHLYRLKTLDMTNNDLNELPAGLGYLKDLNHLLVEGNPLRTIRRSVISGGSEVLKKYLRTRGGPPEGVDTLEEEFDEFALREKKQQDEVRLGVAASAESISSQHEYLFRDAASSGNLQLVGMGLMALPPHLQGHGKFNLSATLVQLNLSKNKLGSLPKEIGELAALQSLIAEECALTAIHPSIANLSQLQHLRLRKNLLKSEAIDAMISSDNQAGICGSLKELDLCNNVLTTVPVRLALLRSLDTLMLSFNRIQSLDGFLWASMQRLSILTLSDNQLESLGTVYDAEMLTSLSIENNNLRQIPAELGRCEHLRALLLGGNPQRSIRMNLIHEGTEAVLKYLRNRLPPDFASVPRTASKVAAVSVSERGGENIPPSNQSSAAPRTREPFSPMEKKRIRVNENQPSQSSQLSRETPPMTQNVPAQSNQAPLSAVPAQVSAAVDGGNDDQALNEMNSKILTLEKELESFGITAAKRFALKKELAMVRSQKIRLLRKLQP
uniref:Disease resistance R13L4/SHOC-2-like LRR domain-containing protein n=1 Tax=Globisporangium ultimum (strain ATCC 200006 / CBS 805.95 / DAOM BR144) TaxID=431595 RepID=K3X9W6_GLOUD